MKLHALILSSLLAIAGCEKTSNVTALQDETTGLANHYSQRLDELQRRISLLEQKGRSMVSIGQPEGLNDVRKLFLDTNKRLAELKMLASQVPAAITNASKDPDPRVALTKLLGETRAKLSKGETEVNANLDAVEQWLAYVEFRPKVTAQAEPTNSTTTVPPIEQPTPDGQDGPDGMKKDPGAPADAPKPDAPKPDAPKADAPGAGSAR